MLEHILEIAKVLVPLLVSVFNSKTSREEIARTKGVDENSSAEDVDRVIELFSDYKEQVRGPIKELEKKLVKEVEDYIKKIRKLFEEQSEIIEKYGIRLERFERKYEHLINGIQGKMDIELSKRVSLDNDECRRIIRMRPCTRKEEALSVFFDDTRKMVLDKCCIELQKNLKVLFEEMEEEILESIENARKESERNATRLSSVDRDNYAEKTVEIQREAYHMVAACDMINYVVEQGGKL